MVCFVIIRHVNSSSSNSYWIESYNCIRNFYPNDKILIIDSNSNYEFVTEIEMHNAEIIKSEFKARGEILGYYYFYKREIKNEPVVIIQDGLFIQTYIPFQNEIKFLFQFQADVDNKEEIFNLLNSLNHSKELLELYEQKNLWKGCFAGMCVVNYEILEILDKKYNFFKLLEFITTPRYSMAFERTFGLLICYETKMDTHDCSLFGDIFDYIKSKQGYHWFYNYNDYITSKPLNAPVIKIWSQRP
jgi:hypothetical protein